MCYPWANKPDSDRMGTLPSKEPPEIHLRSIGRRLFNRLKLGSSSSGCINGLVSLVDYDVRYFAL
jgi:hypothetical protein